MVTSKLPKIVASLRRARIDQGAIPTIGFCVRCRRFRRIAAGLCEPCRTFDIRDPLQRLAVLAYANVVKFFAAWQRGLQAAGRNGSPR